MGVTRLAESRAQAVKNPDRVPAPSRMLLTRGLAFLWIVGGLLQAEPNQFKQSVMNNVLVPLVERQPAWFQHGLLWADTLWSHHLVPANAVMAIGEIIIGLLIFRGASTRLGRAALWISIFWSAAVWYLFEGLGGLMTGYASMIYEFPGAAFLYGALAIVLLLPVFEEGKLRRGLSVAMGVLWLMGAVLQALPAAGFWNGPRLGGLFGDVTMTGMQPPFLAEITNAAITVTTFHPLWSNLVLILIMAVLGASWLARPFSRFVRLATWIWLVILWLVPEGMGLLLTGYASNPGMAWPIGLVLIIIGANLRKQPRAS